MNFSERGLIAGFVRSQRPTHNRHVNTRGLGMCPTACGPQGAAAHLEGFVAAGVGLLLPQSRGLLVGGRQLVPLEHQRLLKLLLRLGLQQLLPEGDVGEERGERPAQLHRRLGAFLWEEQTGEFLRYGQDSWQETEKQTQ